MTRLAAGSAPAGVLKRLLHLPVALDERGWGRLLGQRFIIIDHVGRRSGRPYRTPVEVVARDPKGPAWTVIAAWRERPDWLANIEARPASAVTVAGRRHEAPRQRRLDVDESLDVLAAYAVAHPLALRGLAAVFGWPDLRRPGGLRALAEEYALLEFRPARPSPPAAGAPVR